MTLTDDCRRGTKFLYLVKMLRLYILRYVGRIIFVAVVTLAKP